ncbi:hypothetical protein CGMCC3_g13888 [Colletotrichum fructicola]|uniref:F-box domain-containing protein n=1 Tax=Colletotrichum fructicola (strain Nara gc5) TaxID=1213859 RepID=L2FQE1_COLFN|nr:uncharacterized protein CGMCC3_g13888 [Colletotrichum fructicola]KAE9570061.1 hypothetical protein CGMCC3_g13888 [Colletotrichum fructicola]KAF4434432.1 hypothetical protein CFRS1_v014118 [Colletotrichum fructicola]KAF4478848.1 hypothetical protein CGGC5_v011680 [Colletotrichum fructicola Nara gc5]KAF4891711.1 hypothetical protein CGCFRS4_v008091 [Colletotrichum fructicola]
MSSQAPNRNLWDAFSGMPTEMQIAILQHLPKRRLVLLAQLNNRCFDLAIEVRWKEAELSALMRVPSSNGRRQTYANHVRTLRVRQISSETLPRVLALSFPKLRSLKNVNVTRCDAAALDLLRHFAQLYRILDLEMLSSQRVPETFIGQVRNFSHLKRLDIDFALGSSLDLKPKNAISWPNLEHALVRFGSGRPPDSLVQDFRRCPSLEKFELKTEQLPRLMLLGPSVASGAAGFEALRHLDIRISHHTVIQEISRLTDLTSLKIDLGDTVNFPPTSFSQLAKLRDLASLSLTSTRQPNLHPLFDREVEQSDILDLIRHLGKLDYFSWNLESVVDTHGLIEGIARLQTNLQKTYLGFAVHIPDVFELKDVTMKTQKSLRVLRVRNTLFDTYLPDHEATEVAARTVKTLFPSLKVFEVEAEGSIEHW